MTLRAVAWDIDGTLIDSEPLHLEALRAVCAAYGANISDLPDDAFVGVSLPGVWGALRSRLPRQLTRCAFISAINGFYRDHVHGLHVRRNVRDVVRELSDRGLRQIAVSNSNREIVDANLDVLGIADTLQFSLSLDDVPAGKPDPGPYRLAAARLALPPEQILVVEDSASGIASAREAGCVIVGLHADGPPVSGAYRSIADIAEVPTVLAQSGAFTKTAQASARAEMNYR